jgi:hypothetical protein
MATANTEPQAQSSEAPKAAPKAKGSNNKMLIMIGAVVLGLCFIVACVVCLIMLVMPAIFGKDEGISIPGNFKKYTGSDYTVGFPEAWKADGYGDSVMITSDKYEATTGKGTIAMVSKETDPDSDERDDVLSGNCDKLKDKMKDESADNIDDKVFKVESVKIHGNKACKFRIEGKTTSGVEQDVKVVAYYLVDKDNKDNVFTIFVMSSDEDNDTEFNKGLDIPKTFEIK